jgi:hypothetical protein
MKRQKGAGQLSVSGLKCKKTFSKLSLSLVHIGMKILQNGGKN